MTFFHYFALYYPRSFILGIILIMLHHFPTQVCCVNARGGHRNKTDMRSLLTFRAQITHDPLNSLSSWNTSLHFCQWKGVTCSKKHQRVTILNLESQSLTGYVSPAIGNLSFLRVLTLFNNSFQGEVPFELSYLFRLEFLHLSRNDLSGTNFHNLSGWSNLIVLKLGYNNFTGQVPSEIASLSRLIILDISGNNFLSLIPVSFGNLTSLQVLQASRNMLMGPIPQEIGRLNRLNNCSLELNHLSGSIPSTIYNLSQLTTLSLGGNFLEGVLPSDMFLSLPKLKVLLLWRNNFSGVIPVSILNASNLEMVELQHNKFSGMIVVTSRSPNLRILKLANNSLGSGNTDDLSFITSLTNCSHLTALEVSINNLRGALPESIGELSTKLEFLSIGFNQISGNIPTSMCNLTSLIALSLIYNQLTGNIPTTIGRLQKLGILFLEGNKLVGEIPSSLGNVTSLFKLSLAENSLEGSIPASLGNCRNLIEVQFQENALNGTIPRELMNLSSLSISLDLSHNSLTGPFPTEVGRLTNLIELIVSRNELFGEIPTTLGGCLSLQLLYLEDNSFYGIIPETLKALRGLEELNLSHNNLSGVLHKDLGNLPFLQKLDLSYNNFEGEVPREGVFSNTSKISLLGNQGLCGGIPELRLSSCSTKKHGKATLSLAIKTTISIVSGLFGLFLVLILLWTLFYKKRKQAPQEAVFLGQPRSISYNDLLKATNGFSMDNFVGMGGFGTVYKGILEPDQTIVAIKILDLRNRGASKSFIRECEALKTIRHKNLVKVITVCSSLDHQGNEFKAIVYEFLSNGNLAEWLHPDLVVDNMIQEPKILSLSQRLSIAIDVASALEYLHNHCETSIVHRDLKPSNILLDDQMIAHVGDFGLAKLILPSNVQISTNHLSSSTEIQGTIGYAPAEYGMGGATTIQGDVYSFGIVLLEIFTGKRPTDDMFKDGLDLHGLAKMSLSNRVMEIIDQNLLQAEEEASSNRHIRRSMSCHRIQEWLSSIIKIAVVCSEESPKDRMSIHDALKELCIIKNLVAQRR